LRSSRSAHRAPHSLLLTLHLSIRLPSVYSSCSPSFTLVTPFFLCFFLPFPRLSLSPPLSLSFLRHATPREQVLCSFSLSLVSCPFVSSCAHRSHHCVPSRGPSSLRLLQPADHITALFIKASAIATTNRHLATSKYLSGNFSFSGDGGIRYGKFGSVWTLPSSSFALICCYFHLVWNCLEMRSSMMRDQANATAVSLLDRFNRQFPSRFAFLLQRDLPCIRKGIRWEDINRFTGSSGMTWRCIGEQLTFCARGPRVVSSSILTRKKDPGGRNAAVHPGGVRGGRGKRGQSERAAANEDVESSGARKMGRPAFHPPPGAKGEGKGARSRARVGSEGGRGVEVGSVGSQPCAPTASLVMLFALSSPLSRSAVLHPAFSRRVSRRRLPFAERVAHARAFSDSPGRSTFSASYFQAGYRFNDTFNSAN